MAKQVAKQVACNLLMCLFCIICSTCEVFVLLIKPIVFLTFCSPSRRSILSPQVLLVETALAFLRLVFPRDGVEYEIVVAVMSL